MFHPDTQFLIDHWTSLVVGAGSRAGAPYRTSLRPEALKLRLPRVFIAEGRNEDIHLRLAGSWIENLHATPLTGQRLSSMWREESHDMVLTAIRESIEEARPVVITAAIGAAGSRLEITLAPMKSASGRCEQILGLYTPISTLTLGGEDMRLLTGRFVNTVRRGARPTLSLAAVDGRRVA